MSIIRSALCAAGLVSGVLATPATAAFLTYTFAFSGTGTYSYYNANFDYITEPLQGSTVQFGVNVSEDVGSSLYSAGATTNFSLIAAGSIFTYAFSPVPDQSNQYALGSGTACLTNTASMFPLTTADFVQGCGEISYVNSGRRSGETFSGKLVSASVTRQEESGSEFFQTVGYVPEPTTWALMLAGFGMIGYAMRRRPRLSYAV